MAAKEASVKQRRHLVLSLIIVGMLLGLGGNVYGQLRSSDIQELIQDIISDVVIRTADKAREVVYRNTGIDVTQEGYSRERRHESLPRGASDETRRELMQLREEHARKITKLEDELDKKLDKAEREFRREAAKEDKPEKITEKGRKLERKVDEAYAKFNEKVDKESRHFDQKRDNIIDKSRRQ